MWIAQCPVLEAASDVQTTVRMGRAGEKPGRRKELSKIKGNGTSVPLRHCLHISFHGTRILLSVPSNT